MFDKKGVNCLSLNPYGEKLSMGKEGDNVYVSVCVHEHTVHLEPFVSVYYSYLLLK